MAKFKCYLDEAGDEGYKFEAGSSQWFILAGVIVKDTDDLKVSRTIDRIKTRFGWVSRQKSRRPLHFRKLKHEQKKVVMQELEKEPFTLITVSICKPELNHPTVIRDAQRLFFYTARLLLERLSWYVNDQRGRTDVVFSNRARFPATAFEDYISHLIPDPTCEIRPVIDNIEVKNTDQIKMLQIADACASSLFNALNPDRFDNIEPSYFLRLSSKLYRRGKLLSYGLKMLPDPKNNWQQFVQTYPWVEEIPGP